MVREAIKVLAAKGLVESRPKTGTRVRPTDSWNLLDPTSSPGSSEGVPQPAFLRKLTDFDAFDLADIRFHRAILRACDNDVLEQMSAMVYSALLVQLPRHEPPARPRPRFAAATPGHPGGDPPPPAAPGWRRHAPPGEEHRSRDRGGAPEARARLTSRSPCTAIAVLVGQRRTFSTTRRTIRAWRTGALPELCGVMGVFFSGAEDAFVEELHRLARVRRRAEHGARELLSKVERPAPGASPTPPPRAPARTIINSRIIARLTERLAGKIAVVTGGAQGIGRAIVEKLAEEGARVSLLDRDHAAGAATARELGGGASSVIFTQADVTREDDVEAALAQVVRRHGGLDVLVNNAGINAYFDATAMTQAEWDAVFAVDLKGAWLCCKHALPTMTSAGGGSIVNMASIHAIAHHGRHVPVRGGQGGPGRPRSLALDYAPANIRVNAVLPGWTRTRLVEEWFRMQPDPAEAERRVLAVHPPGRLSTPREVANLVAFVASDEASAITGAALAVDGGLSSRFAT